jgi:hypothetical protein
MDCLMTAKPRKDSLALGLGDVVAVFPAPPGARGAKDVISKNSCPGRGAAGAALTEMAIGVWGDVAKSDDGE